jgi:hypothetical protein
MTKRKFAYWVIPPEADAEFVAGMEEVLDVYARPYDARHPVLCMDEQPIQLLRETRMPSPYQRTLRVSPRGYVVVGGKAYAYFGFLASGPEKGDSWDHPVLDKLWDELNRIEYKIGLGPLKDFKP